MVRKISNGIQVTLQSLIAILLFGDMLINVAQVFTRYVFDIIFLWCEDISTLSLCYMVSFGIPWLWLKKEHVFMDVLDIVVPKKAITFLKDIIEVFGLVAGVVITIIGIRTTNVNAGYIYSMLRYDEKIKYIPLIITGIGLIVASVINIILRIQEVKEAKTSHAE